MQSLSKLINKRTRIIDCRETFSQLILVLTILSVLTFNR